MLAQLPHDLRFVSPVCLLDVLYGALPCAAIMAGPGRCALCFACSNMQCPKLFLMGWSPQMRYSLLLSLRLPSCSGRRSQMRARCS